jgi:nucleoside-diphosphate-sugar epimerase
LKAADSQGLSGRVFNAGNGQRITLNQTWELLQKMEGVRLPAHYAPTRAGDVRDSQADITAVVRDLGYAPRFSFEKGLRETLEWYRSTKMAVK